MTPDWANAKAGLGPQLAAVRLERLPRTATTLAATTVDDQDNGMKLKFKGFGVLRAVVVVVAVDECLEVITALSISSSYHHSHYHCLIFCLALADVGSNDGRGVKFHD